MLTCWHADMPTPSSMFYISRPLKCWHADMPTCPSSFIVHFCILQVPTCHMNTDPTIHLLSIFIEHCTFLHPPSADLPATSTHVAHNFLYSIELCFGVLISQWCITVFIPNPRWWIWWGIVQSFLYYLPFLELEIAKSTAPVCYRSASGDLSFYYFLKLLLPPNLATLGSIHINISH